MKSLPALLLERSDEVIERWRAMVQGKLAPESMSTVELIDHMPVFLGEVIAALQGHAPETTATLPPQQSEVASEHGEQRLRLGFSLDSVVREYGALSDAIIEVAREANAELSFWALRIISRLTVHGIASAVVEYSRQRDAELVRQHNEHFAFVAHELRNPLGTAMTAVSLMVARGTISTESRETAALRRSLQRMQELIDHSLNVARTASGIEIRRERVELRALLADTELLVAGEAEDKNIALTVVLSEDVETYLDVRLVRSALGNLVRNAVKYSAPGGSVQVRATVSESSITVEIEDCCGGLVPGQVEQAFAPFVRLDRAEKGFGLGLAIAKQAVDAHGGSIRVQNLPSKGCIFILELPTATVRL